MRELEDRLRDHGRSLDDRTAPVGLVDIEQRLRETSAAKSRRWSPLSRRLRPLVALGVALGVLLSIGIPALLGVFDTRIAADSESLDEFHLETAELFMDAWVNGNAAAAARLFNPDGTYGAGITTPEDFAVLHQWFQAVGWEFHEFDCYLEPVETPNEEGVVKCFYSFDTELSRTLGWITTRDFFLIVVDDRGIDYASERNGFDAHRDIWFLFKDWIEQTHPDDLEKMFLFPHESAQSFNATSEPPFDARSAFPLLDANSIRLWNRHIESFVTDPDAIATANAELEVSEYVARLVEVCKIGRDDFWGEVTGLWETQTSNFQQFSGDFNDLGASLVWHNAAIRHSETTLARMQALPRPPSAGQGFDELFSLIEAETQVMREIADAAANGNLDRYETLLRDRVSTTHRKGGVATQLGYWLWACPIELPS